MSKNDSSTDSGFINFLKKLQENKPSDIIQFFDRKSFYNVYGVDAKFIAQEYFKTLATLNSIGAGNNRIESQSIQPAQLENILQDLLFNKLYKFEIYAQKSGSTSSWERVKKGSPGNIRDYEELLEKHDFTYEESNITIILSVFIANERGQKIVGISTADSTSRKLQVSQFIDDDYLSNFESLLVQIAGAKECLIAWEDKDINCSKVADITQRAGVVLTKQKKNDFKDSDVEQDLTKLLGKLHQNLNELELKNAMKAMGSLLKYLELLSDDANFGVWRLTKLDLSHCMRLDSAAVSALNLVPSKKDSAKSMNLYGLLNKCQTGMGSRLLLQWIKQPLLDVSIIETRQKMIEIFYQDISLRQTMRDDHLKRVPDLERLMSKIRRRRGRLQDVVLIYDFIMRLPRISETLKTCSGLHNSLILDRCAKIDELFEAFANFIEMAETTIDLEMVEKHEYIVKPSFDDALQELANAKESVLEQIQTIRQQVERKLIGTKSFSLAYYPQFGYCFKVSRKDEQNLRTSSLKYITRDTKKDGVKFQTTDLKGLSEQWEDLTKQYEMKQSELVTGIMEIVETYLDPLQEVSNLITELDVFVSLAHVFYNSKESYIKPHITPTAGDIKIKAGRHPCVEVQDGVDYVANDVEFIRGQSTFHIITGPNMGGKSTYIRSVGVIVLLAQMGCMVPCTEAEISVVDCILARVGAGDSQSRGVSTFMAEMLETNAILRSATRNSLVIIDELGRGTSTYDGFGLAWSISEFICRDIGCFCFFATHFHELTALADELPGVKNYHVDALARDSQLRMLYKLLPGSSNQSLGIHIAEMASFPPTVIQMAKRKAAELENLENQEKDPKNSKLQIPEHEIKEGEKIVNDFLDNFFQLQLDSMSANKAFDTVNLLKNKFINNQNKYIQFILKQPTQLL
eukprot:TRINITY_DN6412_c0_g1_i1.p1 TRINITY_DN6412_c0_g1~~TRINITY_DN6412_c0_g1_i1.p1  ORF type:complete len:914 (-),score=356.21 TRINITY_DN6412_c0_g1_i1:118-2859(-)